MSKLILFDFTCQECALDFEELIHTSNPETVKCPECGSTDTERRLCAPRLDPRLGLDATGFPTMGDKWARTRIQRAKIENAKARSNGE